MEQFMYLVRDMDSKNIKIGYSRNLGNRFAILGRQFKIDHTCCAMKKIPENVRGIDYERDIHSMLSKNRTEGEWFKLSDDELMDFIKSAGFEPLRHSSIAKRNLSCCKHLYNSVTATTGDPCAACRGNDSNCAKTRLKCKVSQSCWKVSS